MVVYHGSKRASEVARLSNADVVLTTYSTLENEYRKHAQPCKVTCAYCSKPFYPERLRVHLKCVRAPAAPTRLLLWAVSTDSCAAARPCLCG